MYVITSVICILKPRFPWFKVRTEDTTHFVCKMSEKELFRLNYLKEDRKKVSEESVIVWQMEMNNVRVMGGNKCCTIPNNVRLEQSRSLSRESMLSQNECLYSKYHSKILECCYCLVIFTIHIVVLLPSIDSISRCCQTNVLRQRKDAHMRIAPE